MTDNRTSELLPCPFCGGEAEAHVYGATGQWGVKCPCGAETNRIVYTEDEAIEVWNRRSESAGYCEDKAKGGCPWTQD